MRNQQRYSGLFLFPTSLEFCFPNLIRIFIKNVLTISLQGFPNMIYTGCPKNNLFTEYPKILLRLFTRCPKKWLVDTAYHKISKLQDISN